MASVSVVQHILGNHYGRTAPIRHGWASWVSVGMMLLWYGTAGGMVVGSYGTVAYSDVAEYTHQGMHHQYS